MTSERSLVPPASPARGPMGGATRARLCVRRPSDDYRWLQIITRRYNTARLLRSRVDRVAHNYSRRMMLLSVARTLSRTHDFGDGGLNAGERGFAVLVPALKLRETRPFLVVSRLLDLE